MRLVDFPDEKPILPGQEVDLSKYSAAERAQSEQLEDLFTRRKLVCLGRAPTSKKLTGSSLKRTALTKYEYDNPGLNSTLIPSKEKMKPVNNASLKRELPKATTAPERYNSNALDQYKYELEYEQDEEIPAFEEKQYEEKQLHSFIQVQNEDQVLTLTIDEETGATFADELEPGVIPTEFATDANVFIDKHTYTPSEMENPEKRKQFLKEKLHSRIENKIKRTCLFPRADGKPCQRRVIAGFDRCYKHLSKEDKAKYYEERESKKNIDKKKPTSD